MILFFFSKDDGCVKILNKMLDYRVNCFHKSSSDDHRSRYCNQKYFKLLVCGGFDSKVSMPCSSISCIDVNKVGNLEAYPSFNTGRFSSKVVYLKGEVYVFGGWNNEGYIVKSIEKYSISSKTWSQIGEINSNRKYFCVCAFMNKIFVIGGKKDGVRTSSCSQFDTSDCSWKEVATMNEARSNAACAVFEERIVVSGGCNNHGDDL